MDMDGRWGMMLRKVVALGQGRAKRGWRRLMVCGEVIARGKRRAIFPWPSRPLVHDAANPAIAHGAAVGMPIDDGRVAGIRPHRALGLFARPVVCESQVHEESMQLVT